MKFTESERERLDLPHQEALAIFNVFRGQVTQSLSFRSADLIRFCSSQHDIDFPTSRPYCEWVRQEIL